MNVYQKIAEARVLFQSRGVKKSGENKFANYKYFELSDILPAINAIGKELGFMCAVSFAEIATLEIIDTEKPEDRVVFNSPMSTAALKGCHEVQNLGAVETYLKRYLYQNAFEIAEADALDATHNPNEKPAPKPAPPPKTDPDFEKCKELQSKLGYSNEKMKELKGTGDYKALAEKLEEEVRGMEIEAELAPDEQAIIDQATKNMQKKLGEPTAPPEPEQAEIF